MYIPSTHEKSQIPILRILSEKGSTAHRLGLRNLRFTEKHRVTQHLTFRTSDLACVPFIRVSWQ